MSAGDAARLLLDASNGFKKFDGSLPPLETLGSRRERWRIWRDTFGAACGIKNCAQVLTSDAPANFTPAEINQMQADAKYLALIALTGSAKDWFVSDPTMSLLRLRRKIKNLLLRNGMS
jgi:hypothetical protein